MPWADGGNGNPEALLQELGHRSVIKHLAVYPPALAPGRYHIHGHARAEPPRAYRARDRVFRIEVPSLRVGKILPIQFEGRAACNRSVGIEGWRRRRRHMIEHSVILIEGLKDSCSAPRPGSFRQGVDDLGCKFRTLNRTGWVGMLRPKHRWQHPGNLGQFTVARVLG